MSRTFGTKRHSALASFLRKKRKDSGLTQQELAARLGRYQSFIADYERGQKRVDVVELMEIAEIIGFDPAEALRHIAKVK